MKIRSIALIGPISYDPVKAKEVFDYYEEKFQALGIDNICNPLRDYTPETEKTWREYMLQSSSALGFYENYCLLPYWKQSPGASYEVLSGLLEDKTFFDIDLNIIANTKVGGKLLTIQNFIPNLLASYVSNNKTKTTTNKQ